MAEYLWKGPGEIEQKTLTRASTPDIQQPISPEPSLPKKKERRIRCTVDGCGRKFKKAMILARHFNSAHEDLREDKDTWRSFSEEIFE